MIIKKYPDLDMFDVDFTWMERHYIHDPADGSEPKSQGAMKAILEEAAIGQARDEEIQVGDGNIENVYFNPFSKVPNLMYPLNLT